MEKNDDSPEDVKRATSVDREIKRGQRDDTFEGYPRMVEKKRRWEHCDKPPLKKAKPVDKSDGDCCEKQKRGKKKSAKFAMVSVFGEPCTFPKQDIIPRHCLTKEDYIDMLATASRRCPPDCRKKMVLRKLKPVSQRIKELAQPSRQRMLITLQQGASILPPSFLDNLVRTVEHETCLTPEQAATITRKKKARGKKRKGKTEKWQYKETTKSKRSSPGIASSGSFDKDSITCQYLMAERFVRSILKWKCALPKSEFSDVAEVIVGRLVDVLEYGPPRDEDRKSQQLRYLADTIACWITGVLSEVAQHQREKLIERCRKKEEQLRADMEDEEEDEDEDRDEDRKRYDDEEEDYESDFEDAIAAPERVEDEEMEAEAESELEKEEEEELVVEVETDAEVQPEEEEEEEEVTEVELAVEAETETQVEPEVQVETEIQTEAAGQVEAETEARLDAEAEAQAEAEAEAVAALQAEADAELGTEAEVDAELTETQAEVDAEAGEAEAEAADEAEAEAEAEADAELTEAQAEAEAEPEPPEVEAEPEPPEVEAAPAEIEAEEEAEAPPIAEEPEKVEAEEEGEKPMEEMEVEEVEAEVPREEGVAKVEEREKETPKVADMAKGLEEFFKTDLPFLTFDKIIDTIYKMVEHAPENTGEDPITNGIHRAIYEKLSNIVMLENPDLLTEELKSIVNVVCGKMANWLRSILSESQIAFMERYMPEVESKEIRDWTKWLEYISDAAKDWNLWLRSVIEKIFEMENESVTRGQWRDWTKSVDTKALLWRRFHLQTVEQAHRNLTNLAGRHVVKTGTKTARIVPDDSERLINATDLRASET